jgi:arylsulfatase
VIDIAATVLEVAGLPEPTMVHGVQQQPLQGTSMVHSFDDPEAAERRTTQYFEMFCNRGIYHQGWTAVTRHSTPWAFGAELPAFDHDVWELYGPEDWTQAHNLANENPRSSRSCSGCSCWKPASTTSSPGRPPGGAVQPGPGRPPQLIRGRSQLLFRGMGRLSENSVVVIKNKSHAITSKVVIPDAGADGVIVSQGGAFGGWSLYSTHGKPAYGYNLFGLQRFKVYGEQPIPAGEHQVRAEFAYNGGGLGKGGTVSLYVDGQGRRRPGRGHRADGVLRR